MNLAFGTLLLFLLFVPGIAFRNAFTFGPLTKKFSKSSAFDDFVWAIIPGAFIQIFFAYLINLKHPYGYAIEFSSLGKILLGNQNAIAEFSKIETNIGAILSYNLALIIIAASLGFIFRHIIRNLYLDHYFKIFRFNNEWYYILRGETIFFKEHRTKSQKDISKGILYKILVYPFVYIFWDKPKEFHAAFIKRKDFASCKVHSVVKTDEGSCYIYTGLIHSFYLKTDGVLDTILIKGAKRRKFFEVDETVEYTLPTDVVVLKYSEIVTISVSLIQNVPDVNVRESAASVSASPVMSETVEQTLTQTKEDLQNLDVLINAAVIKVGEQEKKVNALDIDTQLEKAKGDLKAEEQNLKNLRNKKKELQKKELLAQAALMKAKADEIKID